MRHRTIVLLALTAMLLPIATAAAQTPPAPDRHRLRANITITETDYWDDSNNAGFGIAWEWLFNPRVGLGLSVFSTDLDRHWGPHDIRMTPLTVASLFHMTPGRAVDFYLGPGLSWVTFSRGSHGQRLDDRLAPVFEIGFDVLPNSSPFGFHLDVKHIFTSVSDGHDEPEFDAHTVSLGFVVRF